MKKTIEKTRPKNEVRFSGHETFAFRYAWLPKAYRALKRNRAALADEDSAMVELGLGKNMVRSLRFWVEATGLATVVNGPALELTEFAHAVFGKHGLDPYLEDQRTLWLLHWNLSTRHEGALLAWRFLLNEWPYPELTRSEALGAFERESRRLGYSLSPVTLSQHLDVFLHTYCPTRNAAVGVEDSLDGPLVRLNLLQPAGDRKNKDGRWETVYLFRRDPKPEVTPSLFAYCVNDFWTRFRPEEDSLAQGEVAVGACSPGQVFKLPEQDVRARLETYASVRARGPFSYQPSAVQGLLLRRKGARPVKLADVYDQELAHV